MENKELLRLISRLLLYPQEEMLTVNLSDYHFRNKETERRIMDFIAYLQSIPIAEQQKNYVNTFDFNEKTNLYLTYAKLKEEKDRGQVLLKLKQIYQNEGLLMESAELPDYLPLVLEFMAIAEEEISAQLFKQLQETIQTLRRELKAINSPYTGLIDSILIIMDSKPAKGGVAK